MIRRLLLGAALAASLAGAAAAQGAAGGVPVQGASGNKANTSTVATLAAAANRFTYITGFQCTASGATAANVVSATVSDGTWTQTYTFVFPAGVTLQATPLIVAFPTPVPSTAVNTAITVTLPASGTGGTNAACNVEGYQL